MRPVLPLLTLLLLQPVLRSDEYTLGPDSQRKPGVPRGVVTKHTWTSKIFPGTVRDHWIYVPGQYSAARPACVIVFQDGGGFVNETGGWRAPIVLDNLIQEKATPVTIGIFVNPGVLNMFGPDGRLYAAQNGRKRIVAYTPDGKESILAEDVNSNDLADGSLANGEAFHHLEIPDGLEKGALRSGADGMTLDTEGYLYVATKLGIRICDQPRRVVGIIRKPSAAWMPVKPPAPQL